MTLNQTVFANQPCLNKRLREHVALSYYARLVERMETIDSCRFVGDVPAVKVGGFLLSRWLASTQCPISH